MGFCWIMQKKIVMFYRVGHVIFNLHLGVSHVLCNHNIFKCSAHSPTPLLPLTSPLVKQVTQHREQELSRILVKTFLNYMKKRNARCKLKFILKK